MLQLEYELVWNLKSVPSNCLKINVSCYVNNLKFRTKNALFRYFWEQIEKRYCYICHRCLKVESSVQNIRNFNLRPELPSLDWHFKNFWHIWNQHSRICWNAKRCSKQTNNKKNKTKQKLRPKLPYLGILVCKFEKLLVYLKSTPSNISRCKVSCKNENHEGTVTPIWKPVNIFVFIWK